MKPRNAVTDRAGIASGRTTFRNDWLRVAPSTKAASSRSRGDRVQVSLEVPDRERQQARDHGERDADQRLAEVEAADLDLVEHDEQGRDGGDGGQHQDRQHRDHEDLPALEVHAREHIGGRHPDGDREERGRHRDHEAVEGELEERDRIVAWLRQRVREVLEARPRRDEVESPSGREMSRGSRARLRTQNIGKATVRPTKRHRPCSSAWRRQGQARSTTLPRGGLRRGDRRGRHGRRLRHDGEVQVAAALAGAEGRAHRS